MARVEVSVIGMAAPIRAVGQARVKIADALRVGQVVHAPVHPHRARYIAAKLGHSTIGPGAVGVDPEVAGGSAAIALPACRIGRVAAYDTRCSGTEREGMHG